MKSYLFILLFLLQFSLVAQVITIPKDHYAIDNEINLILINQSVNEINENYNHEKHTLQLDVEYDLIIPVDLFEIGQKYIVKQKLTDIEFSLYFTRLPIISIECATPIPDDPRVLSYFTMVESNGNKIESKLGIEIRGGTSQAYPKKSYRVEFWQDDNGNNTLDYSLLGMRSDDDWNFQAMYNEPLRLRNVTSFSLWRDINTLHYQNSEPNAINGVRMEYAELFLNSIYKGIYAVGERIDRKQLKLKKHDGSIRGELYKGKHWDEGTNFTSAPPFENGKEYWAGYEYEYPDEIQPTWNNLFDFIYFVTNTGNNTFYNNYKTKVLLESAVDYYIFINLIKGADNRGKNMFIAKYKANDPYFFIPWDLDGVFGKFWDGTPAPSVNIKLSNGLFDRLRQDCSDGGFYKKMQEKWQVLREEVATTESLYNRILESYTYLKENGAYEREEMAWEEYIFDETELEYVHNWIADRIEFLDDFFAEDCEPTGISEFADSSIRVYPNPANDKVYIEFDDINEKIIFSIYSLDGKILLEQNVQNGDLILLENLSQGIYIYKVKSTTNYITGKLVVE